MIVEASDFGERWEQYWQDNGQQLVWNDWLKKYPEYNATNINNSQASTECLLTANADGASNEAEVLADAESDCETVVLLNSEQVFGKNCADVERSEYVECENYIDVDEWPLYGCKDVVNMLNTENDDAYVSAAGVVIQSDDSCKSGDDVLAAESSLDTTEHISWDILWDQHYTETYCYYYDWFLQWLEEEKQMSELHETNTLQPIADVDQTCNLNDDVLPSLFSDGNCVETSEESLIAVESLLRELLLTVVDSVDRSAPADGNDEKRKGNTETRQKHGSYYVFN